MKKLRIAQVANVWQSIPPHGYGGTERVIYDLCQNLEKRGHTVHLFGSGDSKTKAKLFSIFKKRLLGTHIPWSNYLYSLLHFTYAYKTIARKKYDIVHGHYSLASDMISLSLASSQKTPSVFTLHYPLSLTQKSMERKKIFEYCNNVHSVSISDNQRTFPLNYAKTIYHGLDPQAFPFSASPKNDLLWLGRIVEDKGLGHALEAALRLKKKITVVGRVDKESEKNFQYFKTDVEKKLRNPLVKFVPEVGNRERNALMKEHRCFVFPIQWEEPFGLVMIEAMACGTPVVAFARGSVPEIIEDGKTGFIVNESNRMRRGNWIVKKTGVAGLCEAIQKIYSLSPEAYQNMRRSCRAHVERRFTTNRMIDEYEEVYYKILQKNKKHAL